MKSPTSSHPLIITVLLSICIFDYAGVRESHAETCHFAPDGQVVCFPQGDLSFADEVIKYQKDLGGALGCIPTDGRFLNPSRALGIPDWDAMAGTGAVSLGEGGLIQLKFTNNLLLNSGTTDPDIFVFEVGQPGVEGMYVGVRPANCRVRDILISHHLVENGDGFFAAGRIGGSTASLDLDKLAEGNPAGSLIFDAVELLDDVFEQVVCPAGAAGADVDAVAALGGFCSDIDSDGDGLTDCWETIGIDGDFDGAPDLPLADADPCHKDLYVEIDAFSGRAPSQAALDQVVEAFADAPVDNLSGGPGITLHCPLDQLDGADVDWANGATDLQAYRDSHFGTTSEQPPNPNSAKILSAKSLAYRYCVFAKTWPTGASGRTLGFISGSPASTFAVTLGGLDQAPTGPATTDEKLGTFMHELGHALGLDHGGADPINCKPNYRSVMNYVWQLPIRPDSRCPGASMQKLDRYRGSWHLVYSVGALPPLVEDCLSEPSGIGGDAAIWVPVGLPVGASQYVDIVPMGGAVNWDHIAEPDNPCAHADANYLTLCGDEIQTRSPGQILTDFNDWAALRFEVPTTVQLAAAPTGEIEQELTIEQFLNLGSLQLDCNLNGIPDGEDIATGYSQDADGNGVPDECDQGLVDVGDDNRSATLSLTVRRNPMVGSGPVQIDFTIPQAGHTTVRIYDVSGGVVAELVNENLTLGTHAVSWDARTTDGVRVRAGVYFVKLTEDSSTRTTRLIALP